MEKFILCLGKKNREKICPNVFHFLVRFNISKFSTNGSFLQFFLTISTFLSPKNMQTFYSTCSTNYNAQERERERKCVCVCVRDCVCVCVCVCERDSLSKLHFLSLLLSPIPALFLSCIMYHLVIFEKIILPKAFLFLNSHAHKLSLSPLSLSHTHTHTHTHTHMRERACGC